MQSEQNQLALADASVVPMGLEANDVMGSEGVTQYFLYLQQNIIHNFPGADVVPVIAEAERRHREIMRQTIERFEHHCRMAIERTAAETKRELESQVQDAQTEARRLGDGVVNLRGTLRTAEAFVNERDRRIENLEHQLSELDAKSGSLVDQAVEAMTSQMAAREAELRHLFDEQLASAQEMNAMLQEENERLRASAMPAASEAKAQGAVPGTTGHQRAAPATAGESLEEYARNRVIEATRSDMGPPLRPPAQSGGTAPAAGMPKPTLPVDRQATDEYEPSVGSPSLLTDRDKGDATYRLLKSLNKLLEDRGSDSKSKVKEAEQIKLAEQPTPETYRHWKNAVREEIRAASDRPDKAWEWLREVYDKDLKPAEKMKKLQDPGDSGTLDTKLLAALTRSAKAGAANPQL